MASAAEKMDELTDQYLKMKSLVGTRDMKSEEVTMVVVINQCGICHCVVVVDLVIVIAVVVP